MSHPDPTRTFEGDEVTWAERNGLSKECTFDDCGACESETCQCEHHLAEHDECDCGYPVPHHSADHWRKKIKRSDICSIHPDKQHHFKFRGSDLPKVCECGKASV